MNKKYKTIIGLVGLVALLVVSSCANLGTSSFLHFSNSPQPTQSSTRLPSGYVCETHDFAYVNTLPATALENGKDVFRCRTCNLIKTEDTFSLDECAFEDQTFVYDGAAHTLTVQGLIPLDVTIEYENNVLKEIGQRQAVANYYGPNHQFLKRDTAFITVVENKGFSNIFVDTHGVEIAEDDKENYTEMVLSTSNCPDKYQINNAPGGIRVRGNGSLTYEKKGLRIKFDTKRSMLGLNGDLKAKSWVLLAEYSDQSMLRTISALYLGNALLNYSENYASSYQHINLYINDEYRGVYLLLEQQQVNKGRINVAEPKDGYKGTDVGYLLELDGYATKEEYFFDVGNPFDSYNGVVYGRKNYSIKSNIFDRASQAQYIKKYLTNLYRAFYLLVTTKTANILDDNFELIPSPHATAYEAIDTMIDLDSLFKVYLLNELMKNLDVGFSSFFMFVDFSRNSKYPRLTFGAPWDFDWSSGNVTTEAIGASTGLFCSVAFDSFRFNPWFGLLANTDFFSAMIKKYYALFNHSKIIEKLITYLDYETRAFANEFAHNYQRWSNLGTLVPKFTPQIATTFESHLDAANHLINWLTERKAFLDSVYLV
ncbi:MAG: hypothetical protein GX813_02455 [Erysipelotrichia bacterium]|nr:hypothetical protein [Erysipelotrichia bacterium]